MSDEKKGLTVGQKVWVFDPNTRVYEKSGSFGGPTYRGHFVPRTVVFETSKAWYIGHGEAIQNPTTRDKKQCWSVLKKCSNIRSIGVFTTQEEIDDAVYVHENGWKISQRVSVEKNPSKLRRIEAILNEP